MGPFGWFVNLDVKFNQGVCSVGQPEELIFLIVCAGFEQRYVMFLYHHKNMMLSKKVTVHRETVHPFKVVCLFQTNSPYVYIKYNTI